MHSVIPSKGLEAYCLKHMPIGEAEFAECGKGMQALVEECSPAVCKEQVLHVGSGRLGAAVQRAMAMRERQSSDTVQGIGAMRQMCHSSWFSHHSDPLYPSVHCLQCGGPLEMNAGYCADEEMGDVAPRLKSQSMRYTRICSQESDDDDEDYETKYRFIGLRDTGWDCKNDDNVSSNKKNENGSTGEADYCNKNYYICQYCRSVPLQNQRMNSKGHVAGAHNKKKGFVRLICRQLLRLHRKSHSAAFS
eukprot:Gb_13790 [translate_table: standard]